MKIKILSSLEKVFSDTEPEAKERCSYSIFQNERLSFQAAFCADADGEIKAHVSPAYSDHVTVYSVKDVPVGLAAFDFSDDFFIKKTSGMYPDILVPADTVNAESGKWYSFWFEFEPAGISGKCEIEITVGAETRKVSVNVIPADLPGQTLIYTNWFHCDAICDYYGVEAFSDKFYDIFRSFVSAAVRHGMNCILTPLFTPALDTAVGGERTTAQLVGVTEAGDSWRFDLSGLKKWVDICRSLGIRYFEMSHFFTQWGAEHAPKIIATGADGVRRKIFGWETETHSESYERFLTAFASDLKEFIRDNSLENSVFFHISDEPDSDHIETYAYRAEFIKNLFGEFPIIDALSDYEFYEKGFVDIPIPNVNSAGKFYGKVPHFWTYYCCGQCNENVPNRFMAMPSFRNRILGILCYKYSVEGFLQWGYNFYNTQYSLKHIDPYEVTDAGGSFPSGDSFSVYPGKNGEAICSLRLKVFYEAMQDISALKLLESLTDRETADKLLGDITFKDYPHSPDYLLDLRERINGLIQSNFKFDIL